MTETPQDEKPKIEPIRYSFSRLSNQATCPARNYFAKLAYEGKIEEDPAYAMVFGSAAHKGIEMALRNGEDPYRVAHDYIQEELLDKFGPRINPTTVAKKWDLVEKCLKNFQDNFYARMMTTIGDKMESSLEVKLQVPFRQGLLTGVVDVIMPNGIFVDWKTGSKIPSDDTLLRSPQAAIYYYLAKKLEMEVPKVFEFVYLVGKNVNMKRVEEGKNAGKPTPDRANPKNLYSFQVRQDESKVNRMFAEYVNPLAEQMERGVIYKNPSDMNCAGCQYKTACWSTELPSAKEAREALVADIIDLIPEV